jgi:hypothetical protein
MIDVHDPPAPKADATSASMASVALREATSRNVSCTPEEVLTPRSSTLASVPPGTPVSGDDRERLLVLEPERFEDDEEPAIYRRPVVKVG